MRHGNLQTMRAIIDVRDMIKALIVLARKGTAGEAYNICADKAYRITEVLDLYFDIIGRRLPTHLDQALLRPSDEAVIFGDTAKIRADTAWAPVYGLRQTLSDILAFEEEQQLSNVE